ncbi:MAG: hypothetical protein K0S47_2719 [Herbinix sp.]|jgi:GNAT superfamily N-acetyltransferase|nr:hypothetical protein [Herbinix sp.]
MISIRELKDKDMMQAIQLKLICWPEELAGMSDHELDIEKEYIFWFEWMHNGIENNDVRSLLGAFEGETLIGVVFASFAEKDESDNGIELNGLWVHPETRGRGISLVLMIKILNYYESLGLKEIIIYNLHNSPSNSFYKKFGAAVYKTEFQMKERVPTDVFKCDIHAMREHMNKSVSNYLMNFVDA